MIDTDAYLTCLTKPYTQGGIPYGHLYVATQAIVDEQVGRAYTFEVCKHCGSTSASWIDLDSSLANRVLEPYIAKRIIRKDIS